MSVSRLLPEALAIKVRAAPSRQSHPSMCAVPPSARCPGISVGARAGSEQDSDVLTMAARLQLRTELLLYR